MPRVRLELVSISIPVQEKTVMEYTRRYPSRYVTCVLLLFTLMLRAGITVAATEAAISGYEIEGISAAMALEEIRSKLELAVS